MSPGLQTAIHQYKRRTKYEQFTTLEIINQTIFRVLGIGGNQRKGWLSLNKIDFHKIIK